MMRLPFSKTLSIVLGLVLLLPPVLRFGWDLPVQTLIHIVITATLLYTAAAYRIQLTATFARRSAIFFICAAVSYIGAQERAAVRGELLVLFDAIASGYLFSLLAPEDRKKLLVIPVFAGLWLCVIILYHFARHPAFHWWASGIDAEFIINLNIAGGYLTLVLPLSFILWERSPSAKLLSALLFLGIVLTKSRAAIIVSAIAAAVFLWNYRASARKWIIVPLASAAGAFIFISDLKQHGLLSDRILWWRSALNMFISAPLTGIGWGNFGNLYPLYRAAPGVSTVYAHNTFLQILAETGVFGLLAFCATLYSAAVSYFSARKEDTSVRAVFLAASAFLAVNIVDYSFSLPAVMILFWVSASYFSPYVPLAARTRPLIPLGAFVPLLAGITLLILLPFISSVYYQHGNYYLHKQKTGPAEKALERSLRYDTAPSRTYARLAEVHLKRYTDNKVPGEIDAAIGFQQKAIARFSKKAAYWSDLAWLYRLKGAMDRSKTAMENAARLDPYNTRYEEALELYAK